MKGLGKPAGAAVVAAALCALGVLGTRDPGAPTAQSEARASEPTPEPALRAGATDLEAEPAPLAGALIVHVTGLDGRAEAGVTVIVAGSGVWPPRQGETDEEGVATFEGVGQGVYEARARTGREVAEPVEGIELGAQERRDVFLALEPGRAIIGRVVDAATGVPIGGAHVVAGEDSLALAPMVARSAPDGSFVIEPLLERPYRLSVRATGWVSEIGREVIAGEPSFDVRLHLGAVLSGLVVDDRGFPVEGATLEVRGVDLSGGAVDLSAFSRSVEDSGFEVLAKGSGRLLPMGELGVMPGPLPPIPGSDGMPEVVQPAGPSAPATWGLVSNERGEFRIDGVPPGRVIVHASHPEHASGESRTIVVPDGGAITGIEVTLAAGTRVAGRVLDPAGFPVTGASVELGTERDASRLVAASQSGEFAFDGVDSQATVMLRAWAPGHDPAAVRLVAAEASDIEIELRPSAAPLAGRVEDDRGFPVRAATVLLVPLRPGSPAVTVVTAEDGTFDAAVPAGIALRVEARHPEHAPTVLPSILPDGPLVVTVRPGGGLEGTVVARTGGFAISPFDLVVRGQGAGAARPVRARIDDLDGVFRVPNLVPGRYRVEVSADGFAPWADEVEVPAPRALEKITARPVDVELATGVRIRGRVLDARSDPVAGARVRVGRPASLFRVAGERPIVSDAQGVFAIGELPEDEVTVWASHPDLGLVHATVDLSRGSTDDVELAFESELPPAETPHAGPVRFGGVAVVLEGDCVVEVLAASHAEQADIRPADRITKVDGSAVTRAALARALRGPAGTEVLLEVRRGTSTLPVLVTRELLYR